MMYISERNLKGSSNKRCDIIKYIEHMSIVHVPEFHNDNWQKKIFFKDNFTRFNHYKFIHHKSHLKPFLSYLQRIVHREYFNIIFNVKRCALYSIKYSTSLSPTIMDN